MIEEAARKRVVSLLLGLTLILSLIAPSAFALDCIYDVGEIDRTPRNPSEGENVIVKGITWPIEPGQSVWITYTVEYTVCAAKDGANFKRVGPFTFHVTG